MQARTGYRHAIFLLLVLLLAAPITLPLSGAAQAAPTNPSKNVHQFLDQAAPTYTEEQETQDKRKLAFAWRELQLNSEHTKWNLLVENDSLKNEIATLQGGSPDAEKLSADRIRASMSQEAVEIQSAFTHFWFLSKDANPPERVRDLEGRFDNAIKKCFPEQTETSPSGDAQQDCHDVHEIYLSIEPLKDKTNRLLSLFNEPPSTHPTEAQRLLAADSLQLRSDAGSRMNDRLKKMLLATDRAIVDIDKQLRIDEWNNSMVGRHNAAHPDHPLASDSYLHDQLLRLRKTLTDTNAKNRPRAPQVPLPRPGKARP
jgi:hypothetical protein